MQTLGRDSRGGAAGWTLVEIAIVISLLGLIAAAAVPGSATLDRWALNRAARMTERQMAAVRLRSVAERRTFRVRAPGAAALETIDDSGRVVARLVLAGAGSRLIDSIRIRPGTIRYNPRGHGSAGSVYLYRNRRGIRVISNFVGRIRRYSFRF